MADIATNKKKAAGSRTLKKFMNLFKSQSDQRKLRTFLREITWAQMQTKQQIQNKPRSVVLKCLS